VAQKADLLLKNKFPYISVIDEASDFKFGMQLGFANAHHHLPLEENVGPGLGKLPNIWGFPFNISANYYAMYYVCVFVY